MKRSSITRADYPAIRFAVSQIAYHNEPWPTLHTRLDRLQRLSRLVENHEQQWIRAIHDDFGSRSPHETQLLELFVIRNTIRHACKHLKKWMQVRRMPTERHFFPASNRLLLQPLGVVGIVAPWNYPLALTLGPAVGALAAGNRVMIKPSEYAPRTSALLAELVAAAFAPDELAIIPGDADVGRAFVSLPFDHLLFTGSTAVGREVAQIAAANLMPVTLELGGKSPAVFDSSCNMHLAVQRLATGKLINAGQTCIVPDYLLVPSGSAMAIADLLVSAIGDLYPSLIDNPDYTAIINHEHRQRLSAMVQQAEDSGVRVISINPMGELFDAQSIKFPPTLLINPPDHLRVMQEEIFGPVLPVIEYDDLDDAIARINRRERPLALYWFGSNRQRRQRILHETIAGGVTINDCIWHIAQEYQPFGGVGASGMGSYHGEFGFRTFSKAKPVFYQSRLAGATLFRAPYGKWFDRLLRLL